MQCAVTLPIVGAICGDIIGSVYEWERIKTKKFPLFSDESRFTDDTVMTIAVAEAFVKDRDYQSSMLRWGRKYPFCGYGGSFGEWLRSENPKPYDSYGNGSAMRVSPIGCVFHTPEETLREADLTARPTHNHPEGIKGAQATALSIFLARMGASKKEIKKEIDGRFNYDLDRSVAQIRKTYGFDETCQKTVPEAIICFLESTDYKDAIRNAVSLGGDSDTLACISGGIAAAYYKEIPQSIIAEATKRLKPEMIDVLNKFEKHLLTH